MKRPRISRIFFTFALISTTIGGIEALVWGEGSPFVTNTLLGAITLALLAIYERMDEPV